MMFRRGKWITKVHKCKPPSFEGLGDNSVWKCNCGEYWGNPTFKSIRTRLRELQREREARQDRTENGTGVTGTVPEHSEDCAHSGWPTMPCTCEEQ